MKLSLCTSLFNSKQNLEIFFRSIETQSYQNWELLICDDCSKDSTKNFIREKMETNKKIVFLENKYNLGLTRSLIKLVDKVDENGYVVRLDDDEIQALMGA